MVEKLPPKRIDIKPWQAPAAHLPIPPARTTDAVVSAQGLLDTLGRPLRDLRISVTDRCNFRCSYCMPKEIFDKNYSYLPHQALLSFEEISRLAQQFVTLGVEKVRLTGGEPLLRKDIEQLVAQLAALRTPTGHPLDLTLTTNGSLLARKAKALKAAGLQRLTVSLDGLDDTIFRAMNDVDFPVQDVLDGIAAAQDAGFTGIKVNMVVKRGVNDRQVIPMAEYFKGRGITLRFIEFMDVGNTNGWKMDQVVPSAALRSQLQAVLPLKLLPRRTDGETAERWGYTDGQGDWDAQAGEIGFISSVTQAFCADCNRARLSTQGRLYLCLFANQGYDLQPLVRGSVDDGALREAIAGIWQQRHDRYSLLRGAADQPSRPKVEMSFIGG
jgi:cyclic pyranopterin phosphate synthase